MAKTATASPAQQGKEMVDIWLRPLDKEGTGEVDQSVTVTINGKPMRIMRGETAQVTPEMYLILKQSGRFPELR